uniref:WD_REPEATS_REGION domain-containing protein n=1 Tax=Glossina brevipalpis TaxID=37001 RepID=A0A1A9X1H2_9MUSC
MSSSSYKTRNLEIIIGTYEEFLLGYKVELKDNKEVLVQSFADKSHSGSIRCVAVHKQWIATGGSDDRIFIYDMSNRSQTQILLCHEGSVNALTFTPDGTHLLSVADDGRFIATRLKTWLSEASWKKAHSGLPVTHVSCHPSGKLALSLGSDMVMRTWNLVKGRVAYKTNLKSHNSLGRQPDCLTWSSSGDYFTLSGPRVVEIWSIKTASVLHSYNTKSRPICICWIAAEACVVGLEDGNILWLSLNKDEEGQKFELIAHNARVKAIHSFKDYIVTASSSGEIKLWLIDETQTQSKSKLIELAATNIGCRPTCINILDLEQFGKDYSISSASDESNKQTKPINIVKKSFPKVVVTVEYDTDTKQEIHKKSIKKPSNDDDDSNKSDEFEDDNKKEEKCFEEESNKEMMNYADTDTEDEDGDVDSMYSKNKRSSLHDTLENKKHKLDISKSEKIRKKKSKICRDRKQNILHSKVKKQN